MARIGPDLLASLFDDHARGLALYARQWSDAPEDVVQEAFVKLAAQRSTPDRPLAWLYRVVRNGAIAASRGDRRRRRREARASPDQTLFASADDRIDARTASEMLEGLDPEGREAIVARLWGGLTFEEIARLQGCSLTTAHRRYSAGLARLHERLERPCPLTDLAPKGP